MSLSCIQTGYRAVTQANSALPQRVPELDAARAAANAKLCAGDGLETLGFVNGGSGG